MIAVIWTGCISNYISPFTSPIKTPSLNYIGRRLVIKQRHLLANIYRFYIKFTINSLPICSTFQLLISVLCRHRVIAMIWMFQVVSNIWLRYSFVIASILDLHDFYWVIVKLWTWSDSETHLCVCVYCKRNRVELTGQLCVYLYTCSGTSERAFYQHIYSPVCSTT